MRIQRFVGITCRVTKLACLLLGVVVVWLAACGPTQTPTSEPAEPLLEKITVFCAGEAGYACFRIPALVVSPGGSVLAFAEGRVDRCADDADINLVLKRSTDHGRTWGDLEVLFDDGDLSVNQPTPIVDHETGEIIFVFCKNNQRMFVTRSADDGATWAEPREITEQATDPSWSYFGSGPGARHPALDGTPAGLELGRPLPRTEDLAAGQLGQSAVLLLDVQRRPRRDLEAQRAARHGPLRRVDVRRDRGRTHLHEHAQPPTKAHARLRLE